VEKRANAFAAMFLMPKPMLDSLAASFSENDLVNAVSDCLKTSKLSARWHLKNLGFLAEEEDAM
jgi:Zn-dependent peptidase ImmA (M78 family)